jgi:hypothetical protein
MQFIRCKWLVKTVNMEQCRLSIEFSLCLWGVFCSSDVSTVSDFMRLQWPLVLCYACLVIKRGVTSMSIPDVTSKQIPSEYESPNLHLTLS